MSVFQKIKNWFSKNKKYVLIGGAVVLTIISTGAGYVLYKNNVISFPDWLKEASKEELEEVYEEMQLHFCKTGTKPFGMEQISQELGVRGAKEWFEKHPSSINLNFHWTDANRWDKD